MIPEYYDKWLNYYSQLQHFYYKNMDDFYYNAEIEFITEIIKNKLYFASTYGETTRVLKTSTETLYFSVDNELLYVNYYYDFGPLNLSCLYKFCCQLNTYLCTPNIKRIVYYSSGDQNKRANAAYLIGSYAIIYLNMSPRRIYQILTVAGGAFRNFVDASQCLSTYSIRLLDCFHAIEKAIAFNFFNFEDFNVTEYDAYDKIQNGDINWLLPRKFLAFIGPTECEFMNGHPPEFYIKYFLRNDVKTVIRLNNKVYDATVFSNAGIEHHELFFADGTTPPKHILLRFLDICENCHGAIGVHCKAGLGRTGSLIGAYIVKHYHMSARECIAWMRICRPGSVIGQQQGWLEKIENWLWRQGSQYRLQHFGDGDKIPHHRFGVYSKEWPLARKRLMLQAQKSLDGQEAQVDRHKTGSPQRSSAPPSKASVVHNMKRPESEKKRSSIDKEKNYQKISKLMMKVREPFDGNNENESMRKNAKDIEVSYNQLTDQELRNKLKELSNIESINMRRTKDRIESEKTQGDRLNEIKLRKQSSIESKPRAMSKNRAIKRDVSFNMRDINTRGDNVVYSKRNSNSVYYVSNMNTYTSQNNNKKFDVDHPKLVKNVTN